MSAEEITTKVVAAIKNNTHQCLVANFANADMVGHTGNLAATIRALDTIDKCLKAISGAILKKNGVLLITADHGNAEDMINWETGHILKEHSANPVPAILVGADYKLPVSQGGNLGLEGLKVSGVLSDVAPTALKIIGLRPSAAMTARSLV